MRLVVEYGLLIIAIGYLSFAGHIATFAEHTPSLLAWLCLMILIWILLDVAIVVVIYKYRGELEEQFAFWDSRRGVERAVENDYVDVPRSHVYYSDVV